MQKAVNCLIFGELTVSRAGCFHGYLIMRLTTVNFTLAQGNTKKLIPGLIASKPAFILQLSSFREIFIPENVYKHPTFPSYFEKNGVTS
ncbi:MAG: hypothetical protein IM638_00910 [Bacteroidetes bacterium]|nr:hypothetical protein [Bacteroidota bacterium]